MKALLITILFIFFVLPKECEASCSSLVPGSCLQSGEPKKPLILAQNAGRPSVAPGYQSAFARRDFQLGLRLSDFRKMKNPDEPASVVYCTDNNVMGLASRLTASRWNKLGVQTCSFFNPTQQNPAFDSHGLPATLWLGDEPSSDNRFLFFPADAKSEPILFWIETVGANTKFQATLGAFQQRYGTPTNVQAAENGATTYTFDNSVSQILIQHSPTAQNFTVMYVLKTVASQVLEIEKSANDEQTRRAAGRL